MLAIRAKILKNKQEFNKRRLTEDYARRHFNLIRFSSLKFLNPFENFLQQSIPRQSMLLVNKRANNMYQLITNNIDLRTIVLNYLLGKRLLVKAQNKYEKFYNLRLSSEEEILTITKKDMDEYYCFIKNIDDIHKNNEEILISTDNYSPKIKMLFIQINVIRHRTIKYDNLKFILYIFAMRMNAHHSIIHTAHMHVYQKDGVYMNLLYKHMSPIVSFEKHSAYFTSYEWHILAVVLRHLIIPSIKLIDAVEKMIDEIKTDPIDYILSHEKVTHFSGCYFGEIYRCYNKYRYDVIPHDVIPHDVIPTRRHKTKS